jgi:hypothetical protein
VLAAVLAAAMFAVDKACMCGGVCYMHGAAGFVCVLRNTWLEVVVAGWEATGSMLGVIG